MDDDKLRIYDGKSDESPLIKTLSGSIESISIMSTSTFLFIKFQSDQRISFEGFLIAIYYGNAKVFELKISLILIINFFTKWDEKDKF